MLFFENVVKMKTENAVKEPTNCLLMSSVKRLLLKGHKRKAIKCFLFICQTHLPPNVTILTMVSSLMRNSQVDNAAVNHYVTSSDRMSYKVRSPTFFCFIKVPEAVKCERTHVPVKRSNGSFMYWLHFIYCCERIEWKCWNNNCRKQILKRDL